MSSTTTKTSKRQLKRETATYLSCRFSVKPIPSHCHFVSITIRIIFTTLCFRCFEHILPMVWPAQNIRLDTDIDVSTFYVRHVVKVKSRGIRRGNEIYIYWYGSRRGPAISQHYHKFFFFYCGFPHPPWSVD